MNRDFPCAHCGATIRVLSVHARLSAGPREEHDRRMRESDVAMAAARAARDHVYSFAVIRRAAAARGNTLEVR